MDSDSRKAANKAYYEAHKAHIIALNKAWRASNKEAGAKADKKCEQCAAVLVGRRSDTRFCSRACMRKSPHCQAADAAYRASHRDNRLAYYEANAEKAKQNARDWHAANKERAKAYKDANKERDAATYKAYYAANADRMKAYRIANADRMRAWQMANHPERYRKAYDPNCRPFPARYTPGEGWVRCEQTTLPAPDKSLAARLAAAIIIIEDRLAEAA
jgi:hypothetical protein